MRQVWLLFRHFLFWQPIMRPVFGLGVLMTLAGMAWFGNEGANQLQTLLILLGSVLMWLFPVMAGIGGFLQAISNPRTALIPHLRIKACIALVLLVVVASVAFALALTFTKFGWQWQVLVACFALTSLFLQLGQWWLSRRWGAMTFWLLPVAFSQIGLLPVARTFWQDSIALLTAATIAMLGWCGLLLWLRQARTIRRFTLGLAQPGNNSATGEVHVPSHLLKWGFTGTRSAANTLLLGTYYNLKNRFGLQALLLALMPLLLGAAFLIPALFKGDVKAELSLNPIAMLAMGLYGSLIGGFLSRECTARLRYLWLRSPGNRMALWQQLDRLLRNEWWVSVVASAVYAGVVWLLTDMPPHYGLWFVLLYGSSLFCLQYLTQYLRVRLTGGLATGLVFSTLLLAAGTLIVTALVNGALWPIVSLCAGFVLLGGIVRRGSQQHFQQVDWCQIKPVMLSRSAALTQPAR